jgi:predicted naringenin-chalcone synthase
MYLVGLATAVPPRRYTQKECWQALRAAPQFQALRPRSKATLQHILLSDSNGIRRRHLALDPLSEAFENDPDTLHARFARFAPQLASEAAAAALRDADLRAQEVDAVIVSTCTGYLCPGLSSYVSERLGLRKDAMGLDLVGQGCGAALPNLRTGEGLIASQRGSLVLSVCVEVCSAAFYIDDDAGVLVSACLFGDGAAAAVLPGTASGTPAGAMDARVVAHGTCRARRPALRNAGRHAAQHPHPRSTAHGWAARGRLAAEIPRRRGIA